MPVAPHVIQRQVLRLRLAPGADGRAVQQRAEAALHSRPLLDALDAALSAAARPADWLTLDRLELDLGRVDSARLEAQLLDRLPALLRREVAEAWATARSGTGPPEAAVLQSAPDTAWAAWLHFLRTGALPAAWPAPAAAAAWETEILALLGGASENQRAGLRAALASAPMRQRLVRQFSGALAVAVLAALDAAARPHQPALAEALGPLLRRLGSYSGVLGEQLLMELLRQVATEKHALRWPALLAVLAPEKRLARPDVLAQLARAALLAVGAAAPRGPGPKLPDAAAASEAAKAPDPAAFVANAGVVLLHPFLAPCFAACGWLADDRFTDETAQAKAVLLVHFLATGASQAAEYELRLPRLLCGVPAGAVSSRRLRLGRTARAEGLALLTAALGHWEALKNTSPEGLREAFLQREGKLERTPDGHHLLTVEQRAQDVLLDHLPYGWGLGVVQLPWMPARLAIHWA